MTSDRHAFRASWHDYNEGIYFVTICTAGRRHIFGQVIDGKMVLNHIVMPNHIHILMQIVGRVLQNSLKKVSKSPNFHKLRLFYVHKIL